LSPISDLPSDPEKPPVSLSEGIGSKRVWIWSFCITIDESSRQKDWPISWGFRFDDNNTISS
jgi:hypothetical protein